MASIAPCYRSPSIFRDLSGRPCRTSGASHQTGDRAGRAAEQRTRLRPGAGRPAASATIQRDLEDSLSEQILFNELRPSQIVVVDCEGDPENIEKSTLVFRSADRGPVVPDAVPPDLGAAKAEE
jgi:hypothetical protein